MAGAGSTPAEDEASEDGTACTRTLRTLFNAQRFGATAFMKSRWIRVASPLRGTPIRPPGPALHEARVDGSAGSEICPGTVAVLGSSEVLSSRLPEGSSSSKRLEFECSTT
jgi:hypothetical protein